MLGIGRDDLGLIPTLVSGWEDTAAPYLGVPQTVKKPLAEPEDDPKRG
ncbi:MAG: hypothetical protein CM15mP71_0200 [Candidatus Poseidoniales archaeon]|nr:MAG: hypothetical protein CM15mP71_0200 [Candidatus Poseidoniales archaeon]